MSWRRCRVLVVFSAMVCSPVHAQDIPRGEAAFTEYVATQLRRETGGAAIVVKGPLTLAVGELQANLDRIFAYCSRDRTGCAREISTYVKGVAQIHKDPFAPPSKEAVRVLVRTQAYVTMSQAALRKEAPKLQPRELAGGLVMLPVIDMPRSLQMLTDEDNEALSLSADEIF